MCIVIDANTISRVLDPKNGEHRFYKPVLDFIHTIGTMVYGGSHYLNELPPKFQNHIKALRDAGHARHLREMANAIDTREQELTKKLSRQCDDPHLIALLDVSGCWLLCSHDHRSFKYITNTSHYRDGKARKIYTRSIKAPYNPTRPGILCEGHIPPQYRRRRA